jgi:hypothetical protein
MVNKYCGKTLIFQVQEVWRFIFILRECDKLARKVIRNYQVEHWHFNSSEYCAKQDEKYKVMMIFKCKKYG